jgi:hypothetical protein
MTNDVQLYTEEEDSNGKINVAQPTVKHAKARAQPGTRSTRPADKNKEFTYCGLRQQEG